MKKGVVILFVFFVSINCFAQDNKEIANIYFKKASTSFNENNLEKATDYLKKSIKYYGGITQKNVAVFGTKLYAKTKQYLEAHKYAKQYFVLAKNKKTNTYNEMLLLYIDIKDAIEDNPDLEIVEVVEDELEVEETIIEEVDPPLKSERKSLEKEISGDVQKVEETALVENYSILIVEEVPVFPGCSGSRKQKTTCLNVGVKKHLINNFNPNLVSTLGLMVGVKKIYISFVVDAEGNTTNISARAPHPELKKEAIRIISTLPKMIPGKKDEKAVRVKYSIPLTLKVE